MKRLLGVIAALVVAFPAAAAAQNTYPTCDAIHPYGSPASSCPVGTAFGAVYKGKRHQRYTLIVRTNGERRVYKRSTGRKRHHAVAFYNRYERPGILRLTWRRNGRVLDTDKLRILIGD